jgi:hypothetical protein
MEKKEFPQTVHESQILLEDLLEFADRETDRDKRRELLLLSLELKNHVLIMRHSQKKTG